MSNHREGMARRRGARHAATEHDQEQLLERALGEPTPTPLPPTSQLRPQQQRDIIWRWQVRRRTK